MLRLLHTSDWHLGRFLHGKSLLDDQELALQKLVELIDQRRPHALLIAGDVFDRSLPPEAAVTLFDSFLHEVAQVRGVPVCLIPGNHDSNERLGFASSLLRHRRVTIFSRLADAFSPVVIQGDNGVEALIYGIPFVEPVHMARHLGDTSIETADDALQAFCRAMLSRTDDARPKVLLCHALVMGGESSDSEKELFIGGSSTVVASAFEGFHYTALGHLHKPQTAGSERVRYCGSLLAYSKSEVGHRKSITEICLDRNGAITTQTHELPIARRLRYLEGTLDELLHGSFDIGPDDHVICGLNDRGAVLDAFGKLMTRFPGLLHISRVSENSSEASPGLSRERGREERGELELFAEFFSTCVGLDLSGDEREALTQAVREMKVEERTK